MKQKNADVPQWQWLIEESETARANLLLSSEYPDAERITHEIVEVAVRFRRRCLKKPRRNASSRSKQRLLAEENRVEERIEEGLPSRWWMCAPYLGPFVDENDSHIFDQRMPQIVERMRQVIVEEEKRLFPRNEGALPEMIHAAASTSNREVETAEGGLERSPIGKKKRGPRINYKRAELLAEVVLRVAPDDWRPKLNEVCKALDKSKIPRPKTWDVEDGRRYSSWENCADKEPDLAIKAIGYWLDVAKKRSSSAAKTLG